MTIALTAIQTPKLSSQEREHGFVQGLPKPDSKKTHTDQSETQPKSCSVHLFIKDSKNPTTIFEVGGRGEAYKIRRTPLGEHGVMKLSGNLQNLKLDGPRLRRRPPPKNITKLKKKQACKKIFSFFFFKK